MNTRSHTRGGHPAARLALVSIAAALAGSPLIAAVSVGDVQVGGFFSQGYLTTSNDVNYPAETSGGTADFRETALNASMPIGSKLRIGAQVFEYRLGDYGDDRIVLDWASIDYNVAPEFGVRAGRVKKPRGLYNEALDLDLVRPFVFLPMGVYDPRLRDFNASFDGGMLYGSLEAGKSGSFDYKAFYGTADISTKEGSGVADYLRNAGIFEPTDADLDATYGAWLFWNTPVAGLRVGLSYSVLDTVVSSGPFMPMPVLEGSIELPEYKNMIFSVEYLKDDWTFAAEYGRDWGDARIQVPGIGLDNLGETESVTWYLSAARRINERFEVGAYYSYFSAETAPAGEPDSQGDIAMSLRFDINEHVLVKLEGHYIDGQAHVFDTPSAPNPNRAADESFTLLAAKMTLSF